MAHRQPLIGLLLPINAILFTAPLPDPIRSGLFLVHRFLLRTGHVL